jgi:hypothetical protein
MIYVGIKHLNSSKVLKNMGMGKVTVYHRHTHKKTGDPAWLPAQLGGRWRQMNWNSVRRGKKYFVLGPLEQPRHDKNLMYRHDEPNEPTKEGPLSFVFFESPFASVLTVRRGHLLPHHLSIYKLSPCSDILWSMSTLLLQNVASRNVNIT